MLKVLAARVIRIVTEGWTGKLTVDGLHDLDDRRLKDMGIPPREVDPPARWRERSHQTFGPVHSELPPGQRMS
jgi:hypothetical protein